MFALAGMAMLALTQCNSGSKEYKLGCELMDEMESSINSAKSCDDLEAAGMEFFTKAAKMSEEIKDESDKATKEEEAELESRMEKMDKAFEAKQKELGCE